MAGQAQHADGLKRKVEMVFCGLTITVVVSSFADEVQIRLCAWAKEQAMANNLLKLLPWEHFLSPTDIAVPLEEAVVDDAIKALLSFLFTSMYF